MTPLIAKLIWSLGMVAATIVRYPYQRRSRRLQALLLPNWVAGFSGLVGFTAIFFVRLWREEQLMIDTFGDEYRHYMEHTSRIIPGIF